MARKRSDEITLRKERGRDDWYICWYDPVAQRSRRKSTRTCDRLLAEEARLEFIRERARGAAVATGPVPPEKYLVMTALRLYGDERAPELKSVAQIGYAIGHLIRYFDMRTVGALTPQAVKGYEQARAAEGIARGTIRRELAVLASSITHAIRNGRLTTAPRVFLPAPGAGRTRFLDDDATAALLAACETPHLRLFVLLALNTGARKGALLELAWTQVQFEQGLIYLNPEGREQTSKGRAIVPMNEHLREALEEAHARRRSPFVVEYKGGRIVDIKTAFSKAVRRAGLDRVTPHTLRHTAGTIMAREGVDLHKVGKVLGHSYAKTTELYAHHQPDWLRGAVDALGKATARNIVSPRISTRPKKKGLPGVG